MADRALEVIIENATDEKVPTRARLIGSLDTTTVEEAQGELTKAVETLAGNEIVFDFVDLKYISSAGLRVMLLVNKKATDKKIELKLVNLRPEVKDVFDMVGFTRLFVIE
ncbi:MAG: STAS domain-containing protein [Bifidobacteriaceae bacterium]|jgi:anti-anti-sigma factor|nr:STAS domain-containing protein [Bifidobacteriaceae bacterium]